MSKLLPSHPAVTLALAFLGVMVLGAFALMMPWATRDGLGAPLLTAAFTSVSAVCVTGLVVVDTGTYWSWAGQVVILCLFQLGGFGMMTAATIMVLLVGGRLGLKIRLTLQAETHALSLGDVRSVAKVVLTVTVVCEACVGLWLAARLMAVDGMGVPAALWHGVFHAVSAFNNAGFSTWPDSVTRYAHDGWVLGPLMVAVVLGGLGFPVISEIWSRRRGHRGRWSIHAVLTLWGTIGLVLGGTALIWLVEFDNPATLGGLGWSDQGLLALFTSVSARTAGFNALDIGALRLESWVLHYALMFIGGGSAGTAGGVKITTTLVILLIVWSEIRGHQDVIFRGRRISGAVQRQALSILVLSGVCVCVGVLLVVPMADHPLDRVLFEVISAFATVGLSTGITADLPAPAQLVLMVLMYAGRVGVVTLALALAMRRAAPMVRYPEEKPIVG